MALTCSSIKHWYQDAQILNDINLEVKDGEFCCIVGSSGCGKSTLLRILAGILKPREGQVVLNRDVPSPKKGDIGFVFQEDTLFPWLTVRQNIEFGLKARGIKSRERKILAKENLQKVSLEKYSNYFPNQLSGGMKQKISIARVLAYNPKILLMDEPFASLDAINRNKLQMELCELWQREQKTIVFVTHNIDEAVYLADRVVVLGNANSPDGSKIKNILTIDLPRPRDRTATGFCQFRRQILGLL